MDKDLISKYFYEHYADAKGREETYTIDDIIEEQLGSQVYYTVNYYQQLGGMRFRGKYGIHIQDIRNEKLKNILE